MDAIASDVDRALLNPGLPPLQFDFEWQVEALQGESGVQATTGWLTVATQGQEVWGPGHEFKWSWIEFLEWLSFNWSTLLYEDGLPFEADPPSVTELLGHVRRSAKYADEAGAAELEIRLWEFLESHDLARSLEGAAPPSLVIWREGLIGHVLTSHAHVRCDWDLLHDSLIAAGDAVAARLEPLAENDRRAAVALNRWISKETVDHDDLVAIATGLEGDRLSPVLQFMSRISENAHGHDIMPSQELMAAARMSSGLPTDAILAVMTAIERIPKGSTEPIDQVAATVLEATDLQEGKPYQQGHALAEAFRATTDLSDDQRFDALNWLESHGVMCKVVQLPTRAIDALACWGPVSGPAVMVNEHGQHARRRNGRNASLAHEICHLIVDRSGALPALEVLGGRVNPAVEARARAFAAEVLLPRAYAGRVFRRALDSRDAERFVERLVRSHHVSREVVAWQARNSDELLHLDVHEFLRGLVPNPWSF